MQMTLQMTTAINDDHTQINVSDVAENLQAILVLAKEIEHLTASKEN